MLGISQETVAALCTRKGNWALRDSLILIAPVCLMSNAPSHSETVSEELRSKAVRLFTYLKEISQLRLVTVKDCRNYEQVLWFQEIPREPECFCIGWGNVSESIESWIEVRRAPEPACPEPPLLCKNWISPADLLNSGTIPIFREKILADNRVVADDVNAPEYLELINCPEVRSAWENYLKTKWEPWAKEHQRWKTVQQVYGKLFSIYQQQKRLGESYELRIALGLLSCQTPSGERVYRHLFVGQANVTFDANHGVLSVQAAAEGTKLCLEYDMLEPSQLPITEQHQAVEDGVEANAETPWDRNLMEPLLRKWVHAMSQHGRYDDSLQPPSSATAVPQVTFAPALILRRRTTRTLVKLLGDISKNLEQGGRIPFGVRRLCEIVDDVAPDSDEAPQSSTSSQQIDTEVYFPLAANEEQQKIVQRLYSGRGVLVQGPPGTGKSHTIANLICHLLAKGKRVLVTSQTPRALKVLQEKIPEELSALCVSILGNDILALKNMENSVLGITERHHDWEAGGKERNVDTTRRLEERLHASRKRLAEVEGRLRHLRELETYRHSVASGSYQGTAAAIAQRLTAERGNFGWLPDQLNEAQQLPLPGNSFLTLLHLLRNLTSVRCAELARPFVDAAQLPDIDTIVRLVTAERAARDFCQSHAARETSATYKALLRCGTRERHAALEKLHLLLKAIGNIRRRPLPWISRAIYGVLSDQDRPWRELLDATQSALSNLRERARLAHARQVQFPPSTERQRVLGDARDLHEHLSNGGGLGFLMFRAAVVRRTLYLTEEVRVNGRVCGTVEILAELIEHLDLEGIVETTWAHWSGIAERVNGPLPRQVTELEECQEALELVVGLIPHLDEAKAAVKELRGFSEPSWHDDNAVEELVADLEALAARDALLDFDTQLAPVVHALSCAEVRPNAHPVNTSLTKAVLNRDTKAYSEAWNELRRLSEDKQLLETREQLLAVLRQHAPKCGDSLVQDPINANWDQRLANIEQAWNWKRANGWLHEFHKQRDVGAMESEAKTLQRNIKRAMAELAAEKAWRHCFERLTEAQRQHLMAWTNAVRRIGRGTGKRAEIHRRDARMNMDKCRDAVPAWIMPFYRLAETIEANPEAFDVVIIDEASQSGPETLALLYLAKQCIVVGDDQQISPEAVGVERADVDLLSQRLIPDLPHRGALGVDSSLFDQAVIRFGRRTVLREHFRCVPEIIRFSNDLCYTATPLVPLRQYPPDRLEPIIVRYVASGFREGGYLAKNRPEAEALVEAVAQCCKDPRYLCSLDERHPHGKLTFGVISLQGEEQAKLVSQLLLDRLTPEEIEHRELVCGDAYAFQGDERDVIFLTMVAAPNERFAALVKESDKRRFNVAASRARDQVWLFHTVTLNELNPDDMRYKLLAYYSNPAVQPSGKPDWDKCDSDFEREVGKLIYAKSYRLIPQYEPFGHGGYRIDFVVEGLKSRLAIECDGPHHDDPEQIDRDMARQRQLERCGWMFWRIAASDFYFDHDKGMASLWRKLEDLGILPLTSPPTPTPSKDSQSLAKPNVQAMLQPQPATPFRRPTQLDLVAPMLELAEAPKPNVTTPAPLPQPVTNSPDEVVSRLKRGRPDGFFTRDDICKVLLAFLAAGEGASRKDLIKKVTRVLDFPEHHEKRVESALDTLEAAGKVSPGMDSVSRA